MITDYLNTPPVWLIILTVSTVFATILIGCLFINKYILAILLALSGISVFFLAIGICKRISILDTINERYRHEVYVDKGSYDKIFVYPTYIDNEPVYKIKDNLNYPLAYYDQETKELFIEENGEYLPYVRNQKTIIKGDFYGDK